MLHDTTVDRPERIEAAFICQTRRHPFRLSFRSSTTSTHFEALAIVRCSHAPRGSILEDTDISGSESSTRHHHSISAPLVAHIPCRARNSTIQPQCRHDRSLERYDRGWRKWKLRAWLHLFLSFVRFLYKPS